VKQRVRRAAAALPELVRQAERIHGRAPLVVKRQAVLQAWLGLAGVAGWTPEMVTRVEREMESNRR
jgi:hypothetical protein